MSEDMILFKHQIGICWEGYYDWKYYRVCYMGDCWRYYH